MRAASNISKILPPAPGSVTKSTLRAAVSAERSLRAALEAGCTAPVGALAEVALGEGGEEIWIRAVAAAVDGTQIVKMSTTGAVDDPVGLGKSLAEDMIADGASALLGERVP